MKRGPLFFWTTFFFIILTCTNSHFLFKSLFTKHVFEIHVQKLDFYMCISKTCFVNSLLKRKCEFLHVKMMKKSVVQKKRVPSSQKVMVRDEKILECIQIFCKMRVWVCSCGKYSRIARSGKLDT